MGRRFRVTIEASGTHGVDRGKRGGEVVDFAADGDRTADALIARLVDELTAAGCSITSATIHHAPGEPGVVDNLVTGKRVGSFG